jgi:hypothetical protein
MYPMDDTVVPSFTCHIGHKLTGAAMLSAQRNRLEYGLCMILTQFKERIELCRILGTVQPDVADDLGKIADEAEEGARTIRNVLEREWVISDQRVL